MEEVQERLIPEMEEKQISGYEETAELLEPVESRQYKYSKEGHTENGIEYSLEEGSESIDESLEFELETGNEGNIAGIEKIGYTSGLEAFTFEFNDGKREEYRLVENDGAEEWVGIVGNLFTDDILDIVYNPQTGQAVQRNRRRGNETSAEPRMFEDRYRLMRTVQNTTSLLQNNEERKIVYSERYREDAEELQDVECLAPGSQKMEHVEENLRLDNVDFSENPSGKDPRKIFTARSTDVMKPLVKQKVGGSNESRGYFIGGWEIEELENDKMYGVRILTKKEQKDLAPKLREENNGHPESGLEWAAQVLENEEEIVIKR